jgi:hypothetical protein
MDISQNPFAILTVIAAPALLTNTTALLALSTSNRFLRASDRMRSLSGQLENQELPEHLRQMLLRQVDRVEKQGILLLNALRAIYLSLGCFSSATIVSIVGSIVAVSGVHWALLVTVVIGFAAGSVGVSGILYGAVSLLHATQISLTNIAEEATMLRERHSAARNSPL